MLAPLQARLLPGGYAEQVAHAVLLQIRGGKLLAVRHFDLQNADSSQTDGEILDQILSQYYLSLEKPAGDEDSKFPGGEGLARPSEVLLPVAPENLGDLEMLERSLGLKIRVAENALDEKVLGVARQNARYAVEQHARRAAGHGIAALEEVQEKLGLQRLPHRIECYDKRRAPMVETGSTLTTWYAPSVPGLVKTVNHEDPVQNNELAQFGTR